jgi:hypothetical protein
MAGSVTRDEFTKLGARVTAVESKHEDLAIRVDRGFKEMRAEFQLVRQDIGTLRREVLGLNVDMAKVLKKLGEHDAALASHAGMLNSHTETLASHTGMLNSHTETLASHTEMLNSHTAMHASHKEMLQEILGQLSKIVPP